MSQRSGEILTGTFQRPSLTGYDPLAADLFEGKEGLCLEANPALWDAISGNVIAPQGHFRGAANTEYRFPGRTDPRFAMLRAEMVGSVCIR